MNSPNPQPSTRTKNLSASNLFAMLFAALAMTGYYNFRRGWDISEHFDGDQLLRPKEWVVVTGMALLGAILVALANRFARRRVRAISLFPVALGAAFTNFVFTGEQYRQEMNAFTWYLGLGLSLGLVSWDIGLTSWLRSFLPLAVRRAVNRWGPPLGITAVMMLAAAIGAWLFKFGTLLLYDMFMYMYDFSNLNQSMWTLAEYGTSYTTLLGYRDLGIYDWYWYAEHFTPIQYFLLPFYAPFQEPQTLILITGLAFFFTPIPLVAAMREQLRHWPMALTLVLAYVLHPMTLRSHLHGFHYEQLFPAFFFAAYYYFLRRRPLGFFVFFLLAMGAKESISVGGMAWGLTTVIFDQRRRWWGAFVLGVSILYYIFAMEVIVEIYRHGDPFTVIGDRYAWIFGARDVPPVESPGDMVKYSLMYPQDVVWSLLQNYRWLSVLKFMGPFAFLFFLRPWTLFIFLPTLMMHLLGGDLVQSSLGSYHSIEVIPFATIAAATALEQPWVPWRGGRRRRVFSCSILTLLVALWGSYVDRSYLPGGGLYAIHPPVLWRTRPWAPALHWELRSIPPDVKVTSYGDLLVPLSNRRWLFHFPNMDQQGIESDLIVVTEIAKERPSEQWELLPHEYREHLERVLKSGEWRLARPYDPEWGVLYLERAEKGSGPVPDADAIVADIFAE